MQGFSTADTIVAIATPPGRGGIGVVRLAGPRAVELANRLTGRTEPLAPRHATFARVIARDPSGNGRAAIDHVVLTWFVAPHSYTGDDVVEISGHGSPLLLKEVVGWRSPAAPGWPSRANSRSARTSTAASIWRRQKRSRISSTRLRRCRRGLPWTSSKGR
jgi:hypothetical protein